MRAQKYRSYSDEIKNQIILSGNPNLYPELGIPVNTAKYWIQKSKRSKLKIEKTFQFRAIKNLKEEIVKERAKTSLLQNLKEYIHLFPSNKKFSVKEKKIILKELENARKYMSLKQALELIGMNSSKYKRWKQNKITCDNSYIKKCYKSHPNQLTPEQIETIKKLCLRRKFQHMSLTALHKYSRRKGWIRCSKESWFKYLRILNISPNHRKIKKKKNHKGIRANSPNEIWHIDVTQIKTIENKKLYLQAIIDNFSRKIISWSLYTKKNKDITLLTLKKIKNIHTKKDLLLFCDQGGENKSLRLKIILGNNIKRVFAQVDTHFSNSMIEAFFRSLKSNFLSKIKIRDYDHALKKISYYIKQHNHVIPHSAFKFETPSEIHKNKSIIPVMFTQNRVDSNKSLCEKCITRSAIKKISL